MKGLSIKTQTRLIKTLSRLYQGYIKGVCTGECTGLPDVAALGRVHRGLIRAPKRLSEGRRLGEQETRGEAWTQEERRGEVC